MNKHTIHEDVKKHLLKKGSITQLQCLELYGSWRLSARIFDLRKEGMNITTEKVNVKTRYGATTQVAKYKLIK